MPESDAVKYIALGLTVIIILVVFLSFHFVRHSNGIAITPKENLTFRLTFSTLEGVLDQYNNKNIILRANDELLMSLVNNLERKGLVTSENED